MTLAEPYLTYYNDALASLDRSILFTSKVHGVGHIERVINLGAHVAQNEKLNESNSRLLLLCCSYHDIGRKSDWYDPQHGSKSAGLIAEGRLGSLIDGLSEDDVRILKASIAAHSDKDRKMSSYAVDYGVYDMDRFEIISSCLKDADNLDRVRLKDLNTKYLRHEKTIDLVPYAYELYESYQKG